MLKSALAGGFVTLFIAALMPVWTIHRTGPEGIKSYPASFIWELFDGPLAVVSLGFVGSVFAIGAAVGALGWFLWRIGITPRYRHAPPPDEVGRSAGEPGPME